MEQAAHIHGKVEYREGDGPNITIRTGAVTVETTVTDATLSWSDGETHGSAAMPLGDYDLCIADGRITLDA